MKESSSYKFFGFLAGLGAFLTKKSVKIDLYRMDDMKITGKRHPYSSDFKNRLG